MGKYKAAIVCQNCGFVKEFKIDKGITVQNFLKNKNIYYVCKNCGCPVEKAEEYRTPYLH